MPQGNSFSPETVDFLSAAKVMKALINFEFKLKI